MAEHGEKHPLPHVTQADLMLLLSYEIDDPEHHERWKQFAAAEPNLAREINIRADHLRQQIDKGQLTPLEIGQRAIDLVTLAMSAIIAAHDREEGIAPNDCAG